MTKNTAIDVKDLLARAVILQSPKQLGLKLGKDEKTIRRWMKRPPDDPLIGRALRDVLTHKDQERVFDFRTADLFAGIGGIRLAFDGIGGGCVFASEWNRFAQQTYMSNFGAEKTIAGDITKINADDVPDHDVLLAGFPCQPFSLAGVSKKNSLGRKHGFEDVTSGTLFFDVARIIKAKRPKAFLLENVKNLLNHDKGNTFEIITKTLREDLGYHVHHHLIDARHFLPQHRERVMIVGFRDANDFTWDDLEIPDANPVMSTILHPEDGTEEPELPYTVGSRARVADKYILSNHLWRYLRDYAEKHRLAGNGFGFGLVDGRSVARTLSARYHKDGSEILVSRGPRKNPRRLTPREAARLMGYDDSFKIPVSDTQAYQQFGNSVAVPMIRAVAKIMRPHILANVRTSKGLRKS